MHTQDIDKGLRKARKVVEEVIAGMGISPQETRIEAVPGGIAWELRRGSAVVMVSLVPGNDHRAGRLRIVSPVVRCPDGVSHELAMRLLTINATELPGLAFGVLSDNVVVLVDERTVLDLDRLEVEEMLNLVGYYGDRYDDLLVDTFGGVRVGDEV